MLNKRGQSQIVSSVLLILLVVTAVVLIFSFVIPFVKDKLSSGDCLEVAGKIDLGPTYTCYNGSDMQVQVKIQDISDLIDGFSIELGGASTDNFKIINNTQVTGVKMCNQDLDLELPQKDNTGRTYVINVAKPDIVSVYPILKGGKTCGVPASITTIDDCLDSKKCP